MLDQEKLDLLHKVYEDNCAHDPRMDLLEEDYQFLITVYNLFPEILLVLDHERKVQEEMKKRASAAVKTPRRMLFASMSKEAFAVLLKLSYTKATRTQDLPTALLRELDEMGLVNIRQEGGDEFVWLSKAAHHMRLHNQEEQPL